ncbi:tRNA (guanosine(37)-N1)-methyltransferase TrmD [Wansuia hejianensis]|uniref:tRNA (guanine-N(1)-)-methyltransferase n=1 Tax=Wansuia hejianensis TaxID=2763667 RepID=A0A926ILT5_9FIRM|nr:tRNA (guanosine(37)-N1)-methyltransferase TrmD [Wansuia hejianensis]MBC8590489.1 tRNA (guanosine(37)-N1)-methyltransferase TrmD [Wansuia hejianensis]
MKIDILTLFPDFFSNLSSWSIIGRAIGEGIIDINYIDIRSFSKNKHRKVDDYPFGGGPGMVMTPQPLFDAINSVKSNSSRIIYLSPQGKKLNQKLVNELSSEDHLVLLCGHYEGIDNRIIDNYIDEEISIGDYVLTGGEIPAMVLMDSIIRLLPGVLSSEESYSDESHFDGLLEHPQYTRPREFQGLKVPEILLSGNHEKIKEWRYYESLKATFLKRPEILEKLELSEEDRKFITSIRNNK